MTSDYAVNTVAKGLRSALADYLQAQYHIPPAGRLRPEGNVTPSLLP